MYWKHAQLTRCSFNVRNHIKLQVNEPHMGLARKRIWSILRLNDNTTWIRPPVLVFILASGSTTFGCLTLVLAAENAEEPTGHLSQRWPWPGRDTGLREVVWKKIQVWRNKNMLIPLYTKTGYPTPANIFNVKRWGNWWDGYPIWDTRVTLW